MQRMLLFSSSWGPFGLEEEGLGSLSEANLGKKG